MVIPFSEKDYWSPWTCDYGHKLVGWGPGGGWAVKDEHGNVIAIDDSRCWFCGKTTWREK